jgi:hypothetical protein
MSDETFEARLQRFVDRQEIAHVIANHSRGIDRANPAVFDNVYHPDGDVAYGFFDGTSAEFAQVVTAGADDRPGTLHRPSNVWIDVDGDTAKSESYVIVYNPTRDESGETSGEEMFIGGRYLDRHERRDGTWRMTHRTYVMDWNMNHPGTGSLMPGYEVQSGLQGLKGPSDPSVGFFGGDFLGGDERDGGNTMTEVTADLMARAQLAFDQQDIHELICAQARAIDRGDEALFRSLFAMESTVDIGSFVGSGEDFVTMILDATKDMTHMAHSVSNEWVRVDGDTAKAESYVIAFTTAPTPDGDEDTITGGRYLDSFARQDGRWIFIGRTFVSDWIVTQPSTDKSDEGMLASLATRAQKYPDDALYKHMEC